MLLINLYKKGDKLINDELCYKLKEILYLIYKYLLSIGSSIEDAEDIIQETFIKTYENIDILANGNIKAWMFKVSINRFYSLYKKSKTNISLTDELSSTLKSDFEISNLDNSLDINKVLSKLSETSKNLLILKYTIGLSYDNIDNLLNLSRGSSKTLCYRARNEFKKIGESEKYE